MKKRGISLIVLIITIIVVIFLAAVVILTISKNNPIKSAKEAAFKEDIRGMQSELSLYLTKEYQKNLGEFDKTSVNIAGNDMVNLIPSTKKYIASVKVQKGDLVYIGDVENEEKWCLDLGVKVLFPSSWKKYIADITDDGVQLLLADTYGGIHWSDYNYSFNGFRPIVCLNSSVILTEGTDGYDYNISN